MEPTPRASFGAAFVAGLPVLLAFFVWHWIYILPIWAVLYEGVLFVALAALGVGWAWRESRRAGRFAGPWGGLAFGAVFASGLLVAEVVGLVRGPQPDPTGVREILVALPPVLVPVVFVAGAGAWLARGWRGAAAFGLAALVLLLYLGGSVLHRGGVGLGFGLFLVLLPTYLLAGVIVGALEPRLRARA